MKYGKWSAILSIVCGLALLVSYAFASDYPKGLEYVLLVILFYGSIVLGVVSLILTVIAYKQKEIGFTKNVAPIVIGIILLIYLLTFVLIMIGFLAGP
ncbi:hypothetical protein [Halalkalibacterium ligniniphilum]|uniref:hypothetical protein n=1 Tax=Halalkalibacterium ligniniphilum TaxID=1134413 RepID=UPI0003782950|nr:hypothetical protein [Halalkalibacterium ligniniphilum]